MRLNRLFGIALLALAACNEPAAPSNKPKVESESPKDSPLPYKVLSDEDNRTANSVEYHVLIADQPKHDAVDALLKYLYRHLATRREPTPALINAYVYSNEVQYKTPPRSPIASVTLHSGELGPTFDNKVPLEFSQQIDQALEHNDKGWKLEKKVERNDANKSMTLIYPFTDMGKDAWSPTLTFNMALNAFTDEAMSLFEKVPELSELTFLGRWNDEDVARITLDRATYQALNLPDIEEQMGQVHGRAYLEASLGKGSDKTISKSMEARRTQIYKKMLAGLKVKPVLSPKLK